MEIFNGKRCVTADDLNGIMSLSLIMQSLSRGKVERVRRACFETPALYAVDSLPYKYRVKVNERFPDERALEKARPFIEGIVIDGAAVGFFQEWATDDGRRLPSVKQEELVNNASILNAFRDVLERSDSVRARSGHRKEARGEFWKAAAAALPRIADRYPNSLPQNARRLQEKFNQYLKGGYEVFINRNIGNANAGKIVTDEQVQTILSLYKAGNNLDYVQIANMYNGIAGKMGWPTITSSGASAFLKKYRLEAFAGRQSISTFKNEKLMQVKRRRPEAAMLMWIYDGWTCEMYYNAGGSHVNRVVIELVIDPCCDYPVGYAIGDTEDGALIKAAWRNAICHTAELFGSHFGPYQSLGDNYGSGIAATFLGTTVKHITNAAVGNAKSKVIEPYFKYLNKNYCQLMNMGNWSGFGVKSRNDRQPSVDWLKMHKDDFPDRQGVIRQIDAIIAMERATKREKYLEMWSKTDEAHKMPMSLESFLLNYGYENGRRYCLEGSGLRPTIEGVKYAYDCFDINFRRHDDIRWMVKYDPSDMSRALAVSEDGTYRFLLEEKYVQPMALAERKEGDAEQLKRIRDFNTAEMTEIAQINSHADEVMMNIFRHNSELDNTLGKHILTNAAGQHKDLVSQKRLKEAKEARELKPVEVSVPEKKAVRRRLAAVPEEEVAEKCFDIY